MKLLVDMNLSPLWVEFPAGSGFESMHWREVGPPFATDGQIVDYAGANGLVIFTHDLDFGALLAARKLRQPSVIQVRAQDVLPSAIGETVVWRPPHHCVAFGGWGLGHSGPRPKQDSFAGSPSSDSGRATTTRKRWCRWRHAPRRHTRCGSTTPAGLPSGSR